MERSPGATAEVRRPLSLQETVSLELLSALFLILGLVTWGAMIVSIFTNSELREATQGAVDTSATLVFLDNFGIVVPALAIVLGGLFFYLGLRLRTAHVTFAQWAQVSLVWLIVACFVVGTVFFINTRQVQVIEGSETEVWDFGESLETIFPLAVAALVFFLALRWLNENIKEVFSGEESLGSANARVGWSLLIPTVAILVFVAARPLEETFITSLTDKRFGSAQTRQFIGLDNYANLLSFRLDTVECRREDNSDECVRNDNGGIRWELIDREKLQEGYRTAYNIRIGSDSALAISGKDSDFIRALWNTLVFTFISVTAELILGLFIAMVVNSKFVGRGMLRTAMLVPWAIPTVVSARLWETMLRDNRSGIINKFLLDLGVIDTAQSWLTEASLQIYTLAAIDVWKTTPFMALLLLAGLQTIPADIYEAADVDGASKVRQFFSVTLPLLRPTIAVALVFRTLDSLRVFDVFQVLLGRQKLSLATYNYETLISNQDGGYASAIGVVIFILILMFTIVYVQSLGVEE